MAFSDLFIQYPNRNKELRFIARTFFEFGMTIATEPSAAHSQALDEHAIQRQIAYVARAKKIVERIAARPTPDLTATHPTDFPIDFTQQYKQFVDTIGDDSGQAINEATSLLAEYWMTNAVELAKSQSASAAGALNKHDKIRALNNLGVIEKYINELEEDSTLDLPETAVPGAENIPVSNPGK